MQADTVQVQDMRRSHHNVEEELVLVVDDLRELGVAERASTQGNQHILQLELELPTPCLEVGALGDDVESGVLVGREGEAVLAVRVLAVCSLAPTYAHCIERGTIEI